MILAYILISVFLVSLGAFVGVITLFLKPKFLEKILFGLVSFAAGALLGAAFLDLLPEALENNGGPVLVYALVGVVVFYVLETFLFWYHCHYGHHHHHERKHKAPMALLNLFGDGVHNFVDGMIIAAAYLSSIQVGIAATVAVLLHEIPQELGDFGILIYGGLSRKKALFFNFLCALTAVLGALAVYFFSTRIQNISAILVPFAAGGFIYIASADLLPELHKERNLKKAVIQLFYFLLGIAIIYGMTFFE
ncbi:MAG: ZIP family metal transporter [Candidatus Woesearchaeota archaeon]|nr:ZIP family metal transporter [Candidatus Woesearchaeota archaeon]